MRKCFKCSILNGFVGLFVRVDLLGGFLFHPVGLSFFLNSSKHYSSCLFF